MRKYSILPGLVLASFAPFASLAAQTLPATPPTAGDVTARIATQNALFEDYYQNNLKNHPEQATSVGDYRYNDRLSDDSLAAIAREHAEADAYLARLKAIATDGMPEQDRLSHELLERALTLGDENYTLKTYEMPVNQQNGIHTGLADLPQGMPFDSVKHYEDYIARLHQIPRVLDGTTEVMRAGEKDGLMPVKFIMEKIPGQCEGIIAADPFLLPTKKYPATISAADQTAPHRSHHQGRQRRSLPGVQKVCSLRPQRIRAAWPHGSLGRKPARRQAPLCPRRAHDDHAQRHACTGARHRPQRGRAHHRRDDQARASQRLQGPTPASAPPSTPTPSGSPAPSSRSSTTSPSTSTQMEPRLPELFTLLPKSPVTVEPIPDFAKAEATHYNAGTPDGKRPGRVVVAVADPTTRTLVLDEAVAYHEGVPGHHDQISVAQQLKGLPKFRLRGFYSAYTEGWALYAEQLGKEIGFYQNPVSDYGRLNSELFRAVRLVVDTGIHDQSWTRQQVIDYMHANDVNDALAQTETDRYIAWPGQALAYKMGQLKIRELREKAKTQLGPHFDIKTFHDEILNGGAMPLDLLDARVTRWINSQAPASASVRR